MTGKELRKMRLSAKLTQEQLNKRLGCSVYTVVAWETGRRPINRISEIAIGSVMLDVNKDIGKLKKKWYEQQ